MSSETSSDQPNGISEFGHSVLLGEKLYFPCEDMTRIMEYNVGEPELQVIDTDRLHIGHLEN